MLSVTPVVFDLVCPSSLDFGFAVHTQNNEHLPTKAMLFIPWEYFCEGAYICIWITPVTSYMFLAKREH